MSHNDTQMRKNAGSTKVPIIRENGISATATLINFLKGMIGPGCLSLPLAFKQAGLVTAFVLIVVFGFLNCFCMLQLVHCSQRLSRRKGDASMDYGTVAYEACAEGFQRLRKYKKYARRIVNTTIIALQVGVCSVFYVFIATHMKEICENLIDVRISESSWMMLIFVPMIMICMLRTLKTIVIISTIGNVLMIVSLVFILQFLLRADHEWADLPWITNFNGVMAACGSILYSFEGQAMVLPMENRLKHPTQMVGSFGVLSIGMTTVTSVYVVAGLSGYVTYGESVRGSITQSLPNEPMWIVVRIMLTLVIYFGYVIQQYVIVDMIWPALRTLFQLDSIDDVARLSSSPTVSVIEAKLPPIAGSESSLPTGIKKNRPRRIQVLGAELTLRVGIVFLTMMIAILVPSLDDIIPLIGMMAGMLLAFIFPATIDTILFVPELLAEANGRLTARVGWRLIQNAGLCLIGLFGLVFGLKFNIETIVLGHVQ